MSNNELDKISLSLYSIGLGSLFIIIFVVSSVFYLFGQNKNTFDEFVGLVETTQSKSEHAHKLKNSAYKRGYVQYQMILTLDPFERDALYPNYYRFANEVMFHQKTLIEKSNEQEKAILDKQLLLIDGILDVHNKIEDALAQDNLTLAGKIRQKAYTDGTFNEFFISAEKILQLQKAAEKKLLIHAQKKFEDTMVRGKWLLFLISSIIIVFVIYVLTKLYKKEKEIQIAVSALEDSNDKHKTMSMHDHLTQLPNRFYLYTKMAEIIFPMKHNDYDLFVIFFDLDGFKYINDNLGHEAGDELLQAIANRLTKNLSKDLFISRVGGDEFIVIASMTKDECTKTSNKILELIGTPFEIKAKIVNISTSIGISQYNIDADNPDDLVKYADIAMYIAKRSGGNQFCYAASQDAKTIKAMEPVKKVNRNTLRDSVHT